MSELCKCGDLESSHCGPMGECSRFNCPCNQFDKWTRTLVTDIDGVLLDFGLAIRSVLENLYWGELKTPHCYTLEEAYGIPAAVLGKPSPHSDTWRDIYATPAKLYPDALEFVARLKAAGINVIGLSYRCEAGREASRRDLAAMPFDELHYVDDPKDKPAFVSEAARNGQTWYIDDHPVYAADMAEAVPSARVYLITREWNQRCLDLGNYHRVSNFVEILREVEA